MNSGLAQKVLPTPVKNSAYLMFIEAAAALIFALVAIVHQAVSGKPADIDSTTAATNFLGYGTAIFVLIIFGAGAAGAFFMLKGHRLGRGPVVFNQLMMLPIAYYMFSAGKWLWALPVILLALATMSQLFSRAAILWSAASDHN